MNECIICKGKAGAFSKKSLRGMVCKNCLEFIPKGTPLEVTEDSALRAMYEDNKIKAKTFEATASFGDLYIDQTKGMFCISKRSKKEQPLDFNHVYTPYELRGIGLYCSDVRNIGTNSNKIVCDVKFKVQTDTVNTEFVIARGKDCPFKIVGDEIKYSEPAELGMFRTMIDQMLEGNVIRYAKMLERVCILKVAITKEQRNIWWARGIMCFTEDETLTDNMCENRYNELTDQYHSDKTKLALLRNAYHILTNKEITGVDNIGKEVDA